MTLKAFSKRLFLAVPLLFPALLYGESRRNSALLAGHWERSGAKGTAFLTINRNGTINFLDEDGSTESSLYQQQGIWTFHMQTIWGKDPPTQWMPLQDNSGEPTSYIRYMRVSWDGSRLYINSYDSPGTQVYVKSSSTW